MSRLSRTVARIATVMKRSVRALRRFNRQALRQRRQSDPRELLVRGKLEPKVDQRSLLFFTVHKAASSFVGRLLERVAAAHDIWSIDFEGQLFDNPLDGLLHTPRREAGELLSAAYSGDNPALLRTEVETLRNLFLPQGCLYAPIRQPTLLSSLPHLSDFQVIVFLRDPRDCLTSLYYSVAFSHRPPRDPDAQSAFFQHRERIQQWSLDDFVLSRAPRWAQRYGQYCNALDQHDNVELMTYEQFVLDFPAWVDRLSQLWGLPIEGPLRQDLMQLADFDVGRENIYAHKRQVTPGDHRRKLRPDTIETLNRRMAPVLERLGYALEPRRSRAA